MSDVVRGNRPLDFASFGFLFFSLFPYLSIIPIPTDTQPYALLFAMLVLSANPASRLPRQVWLLLIPIVASFVVLVTSVDRFTALRSFVGYVSFFTISSATVVLAQSRRLPVEAFSKALWIYVAFGAVQAIGVSGFGVGLIADSRTGGIRGVTSLAPEPSYYAIVLTILMSAILFFDSRRRPGALIAGFVSALLLAKSGLGAIFLGVLIFAHAWFSYRKWRPVIVVSGLALYLFLINFGVYLPGRLPSVAGLLRDPRTYLLRDGSVSDRFYHIVLSVRAAFENWLVPRGVDNWRVYALDELAHNPAIRKITVGRIMSAYGGALFELGVFGLALPFATNAALRRSRSALGAHYGAAIVVINMLLITAVPLASPLLALLFGRAIAFRDREDAYPTEPVSPTMKPKSPTTIVATGRATDDVVGEDIRGLGLRGAP